MRNMPSHTYFSRPLSTIYIVAYHQITVVQPYNCLAYSTSHPGGAWQDRWILAASMWSIFTILLPHIYEWSHVPNQTCKPQWEIESHGLPRTLERDDQFWRFIKSIANPLWQTPLGLCNPVDSKHAVDSKMSPCRSVLSRSRPIKRPKPWMQSCLV